MGKIKTESGVWIPATYKGNRYAQWKERTKVAEQEDESDEEKSTVQNHRKPVFKPNTHWARHNEKMKMKQKRSELKTTEQIFKARNVAEKKKQKQKKRGRKTKKTK